MFYFAALYTNLEVIRTRTRQEAVVMDRYYLSFRVYGPLNGVPLDDVLYLTKYLIEPDYYFFLDIPPENAYERIMSYRSLDVPEVGFANYQRNPSLGKEEFLRFQSKVREKFQIELKDFAVRLDALQPPETLHSEIVDRIRE